MLIYAYGSGTFRTLKPRTLLAEVHLALGCRHPNPISKDICRRFIGPAAKAGDRHQQRFLWHLPADMSISIANRDHWQELPD